MRSETPVCRGRVERGPYSEGKRNLKCQDACPREAEEKIEAKEQGIGKSCGTHSHRHGQQYSTSQQLERFSSARGLLHVQLKSAHIQFTQYTQSPKSKTSV